ncbi:MAG: hypothetical protein V3S41_07020, partial [Spirochaetia bacterium]
VTFGAFTPLGWLPPLGFTVGVLMFVLHTYFWITLTLMMGTFFESATVVIAVPMAIYFAFWFLPSLLPFLVHVSPLLLTFSPDPALMDSLAGSFMTGEFPFSWIPLIFTVACSVVFIIAALWRFNRQEF